MSGGPAGLAAMASQASSSSPVKPSPPKGGANQRARMKLESLRRTSRRVSGATVRSTVSPRRRSSNQRIGRAQNLVRRESGRASGVNQHIGIGGAQPQVGQRLDRLAGLQRMGEEHAVDPARARPGDDVRHHAQAQLGFGLGSFEDVAIDDLLGEGAPLPPHLRPKKSRRP